MSALDIIKKPFELAAHTGGGAVKGALTGALIAGVGVTLLLGGGMFGLLLVCHLPMVWAAGIGSLTGIAGGGASVSQGGIIGGTLGALGGAFSGIRNMFGGREAAEQMTQRQGEIMALREKTARDGVALRSGAPNLSLSTQQQMQRSAALENYENPGATANHVRALVSNNASAPSHASVGK